MADRIAIDFRHTTVYFETALNAVGATTSVTLRTGLLVPGANDAYVKRFGTPYPVIDILAAVKAVPRGGAGNIGRYRIYAADGLLLGTVIDNGVSAYADGGIDVVNTDIYIVLDCTLGAYTLNDGDVLQMDTDVDVAGLNAILSGETVTLAGGETITWWLSSSGSTYYDTAYIYGGNRHTPALGSAKYPYFTISAGVAAAVAAGTVVEIMDSETYQEAVQVPGITVQAALGHTPRVIFPIGAHAERDAIQYNNSTAVYVNPNGIDANPGTFQLPFATIAAAYAAAAGAAAVAIGGVGATAGMIFSENLTFNAANFVVADYGYVPEIRAVGNAVTITMTGAATLQGCVIRGQAIAVDMVGAAGTVQYCSCFGCGIRGNNGTVTVEHTEIASAAQGILAFAGAGNLVVNYCSIHDCIEGIHGGVALGAGTAIFNNDIYECTANGMAFDSTINVAAGISHNTIYDCTFGMWFDFAGAVAVVPVDIIVTDCTTGVQLNNAATTLTINFCAIANNGASAGGPGLGGFTPTNAIAGDPLLVDPANGLLGIRADSPCYHAASGGDNAGAERWIVQFIANTCVIDGLIIDGRGANYDGVTTSIATRTNCVIKWCSLLGHHSMGIDNYAVAVSTWTITNCDFRGCGTGIMCAHQDNTINECVFSESIWSGIYLTQTGQAVTHVSVFAGANGLRLSAAASVALIDSIFSGQSEYAIYSDAWIYPTFCNIEGAVSALVNLSDASNLNTSPFFIDTESTVKDLHLWTIAAGYPVDSPCIDAASDGFDMGAYLIDRGVADGSWETYILPNVIMQVSEGIVPKGAKGFEVVTGSHSLAGKTHKRRVDLRWPTDTASKDAEFRQMIELLNTFIEDDHQGWTPEQIIMRLHLKPTELLLARFTGTVDASAQTTFDPAAAWIRNAWRGYDATHEWYESAVGVLDDVAKTLAVAGAPWVVDEWIGYWFPQAVVNACGVVLAFRWFLVLANTVNTITYSDPYDLSVSVAAAFSFAIVSWHKVASNDAQYLCLEDEDADLLRDGETPHVYVDILRTRLQRSGVTVRGQLDWRSDYEHDRIPDRLRLEEI